MGNVINILQCNYIGRNENDDVLQNMEIIVKDLQNNCNYTVNVDKLDDDFYKTTIEGNDDVFDLCIIDSSGGIYHDFTCDNVKQEIADEIQRMVINYFIKEF